MMKLLSRLGCLLAILMVMALPLSSHANEVETKVYRNPQGVYSIQIPASWQSYEKDKITNLTNGTNKLIIIEYLLFSVDNYSEEKKRNILQKGINNSIKFSRKKFLRKDEEFKYVSMDGAPGVLYHYEHKENNGTIYATIISFFKNGYYMTISCESTSEEARVALENIAYSISIER